MRSTLRGIIGAAILSALSLASCAAYPTAAAAAATVVPSSVAAGQTVTVSGPVTLATACANCAVYMALNDATGKVLANAPTLTATFVAKVATQITSTFTVPPGTVAGSYALFYNVFTSATGGTAVAGGLGTLATVPVVVSTPVANPNQLTISWIAPTSNTDGSTPAKVTGYNLYFASTDAALTALPNVGGGTKPCPVGNTSLLCATAVQVPALSYQTVGLPAGTYFADVTAFYCPTGSTACTESGPSAHVSGTISAPVTTPTPNTPGSVTITAVVTVTATSK